VADGDDHRRGGRWRWASSAAKPLIGLNGNPVAVLSPSFMSAHRQLALSGERQHPHPNTHPPTPPTARCSPPLLQLDHHNISILPPSLPLLLLPYPPPFSFPLPLALHSVFMHKFDPTGSHPSHDDRPSRICTRRQRCARTMEGQFEWRSSFPRESERPVVVAGR